jgi:Flp pilus assembly protein TadD
LRPDDADALYYLGRALLESHQTADAIKSLQMAVRINPADSHARNALAAALAQTKNLAAARVELQAACAQEPDNAVYRRNLECIERGLRDCAIIP